MDYKEQVALIRGLAYEWNKCSHITKIGGMKLEEFLLLTATAITDLLARAEAAEDRAEKAEKCITEIEEALKFQRYSASMFFISKYRGQKEE